MGCQQSIVSTARQDGTRKSDIATLLESNASENFFTTGLSRNFIRSNFHVPEPVLLEYQIHG
jgi:hypothetical protein